MTALAMSLTPEPGPNLDEIARELSRFGARVVGDGSVRPSGVRQDSRRIEPGEMFSARDGRAARGADFARDALRRGASALFGADETLAGLGVPLVLVDDPARALGAVAELVYGRPSRALSVVAITGTNGKTTTSFLLEHALAELGRRPARLGTLGFSFAGEEREGSLTTPEADDVARCMAEVVRRGGSDFVMEASSHALAQGRVEAVSVEVAALTNLTQDHLDFHASMAEYGAAKARLFTELSPRVSVLNVDDAFGKSLVSRARGRVITVGRAEEAEVRVLEASSDARGIRARLRTPSGTFGFESPLVGAHNLENSCVAFGVLVGLGFSGEKAALALGRSPQVPGRLERCDIEGDELSVLVDYAHTPDALERVLAALRPLAQGELVCVFGCGGDRDPKKRPLMGAAVARGASRAVVTSDNPRSEDPAAIARAVEAGFAGSTTPYSVELDRAVAIERAVFEARPGDVVLIAGKGHESYQLVAGERRAFDDRVEARHALARRRTRSAG